MPRWVRFGLCACIWAAPSSANRSALLSEIPARRSQRSQQRRQVFDKPGDKIAHVAFALPGATHGIMIVNAFYENVNLHKAEGRELADGEAVQNLVLEFRPRPTQDMLVACLWSKWTGPDEPDLLSFAAITDEPPEEVAAAGHDRCIVPIRPENIDAWLNPNPRNLTALYAILDDRERPYYEHRMAA